MRAARGEAFQNEGVVAEILEAETAARGGRRGKSSIAGRDVNGIP
jgi:hypothetical protein